MTTIYEIKQKDPQFQSEAKKCHLFKQQTGLVLVCHHNHLSSADTGQSEEADANHLCFS